MQVYARYAGDCTYCGEDIEADATPKTDHGFSGPLDVDWRHLPQWSSNPPDYDHNAVPRGPWRTQRNSERFVVDPYGEVATLDVPIGVLEEGHEFVGWDGDTVYRVTAPYHKGVLGVVEVLKVGQPCDDCGPIRDAIYACECGGQSLAPNGDPCTRLVRAGRYDHAMACYQWADAADRCEQCGGSGEAGHGFFDFKDTEAAHLIVEGDD